MVEQQPLKCMISILLVPYKQTRTTNQPNIL